MKNKWSLLSLLLCVGHSRLFMFGSNTCGQLGLGLNINVNKPTAVKGQSIMYKDYVPLTFCQSFVTLKHVFFFFSVED